MVAKIKLWAESRLRSGACSPARFLLLSDLFRSLASGREEAHLQLCLDRFFFLQPERVQGDRKEGTTATGRQLGNGQGWQWLFPRLGLGEYCPFQAEPAQ